MSFAAAFPEIAVTASVDVLPEAGEYERTSTTAVNAYVLPALRGYLSRLEEKLRACGVAAPLLIGNSNGGLSSRQRGAGEAGLLHLVGPRVRRRRRGAAWRGDSASRTSSPSTWAAPRPRRR